MNVDKDTDKGALFKAASRKYEGRLLCLCLTAACLSAPLNGLSPSLTLVALEFGFTSQERDIYLGKYRKETSVNLLITHLLDSTLHEIIV